MHPPGALRAWKIFCGASSIPDRARQSGRPVDPVVGPDGALYVSDDDTGNIYRVAYIGPRIAPGA